jgi:hypothetical protein
MSEIKSEITCMPVGWLAGTPGSTYDALFYLGIYVQSFASNIREGIHTNARLEAHERIYLQHHADDLEKIAAALFVITTQAAPDDASHLISEESLAALVSLCEKHRVRFPPEWRPGAGQ